MTSATLAQSVAASIRAAILNGDYLSGERLIELTLARSLAVSQNTIRDALRILEQEGWVIKRARRGVYVRSFSIEDALEIYTLLASVETLALVWAMAQMRKSDLAEIAELLAAARRYAHLSRWRDSLETLFQFHIRLAQLADKPLTLQLLEQLYNQARILEAVRQARAPRNLHELQSQLDAHDALLKCIEADDASAAQRQLRELIASYGRLTVAALKI
jgi:DNA-binding GntR family transcriptional regulator